MGLCHSDFVVCLKRNKSSKDRPSSQLSRVWIVKGMQKVSINSQWNRCSTLWLEGLRSSSGPQYPLHADSKAS